MNEKQNHLMALNLAIELVKSGEIEPEQVKLFMKNFTSTKLQSLPQSSERTSKSKDNVVHLPFNNDRVVNPNKKVA